MSIIRIAAGQGFWGDWLEAPVEQVRRGPIDYLMLDYLAEVTMSILAKQKSRDPNTGYARDFPALMERILPDIVAKNIKVLANAGGMNPTACALAVRAHADKLGLGDKVRIGVVRGDDLLPSLDSLFAAGETLNHLETRAPLASVRSALRSANVYLGVEPIVAALKEGANIIITGRVADPSLALAPAIYEFGWAADDWDRLASGTIAGHIIECGPQSTGGNFSADWRSVSALDDVGYPIVEMHKDGSFVLTKHEGTGGLVSEETVKEQLLYEIGDPRRYLSPDVCADFTSIRLTTEGKNRVRISSAKGSARPDTYKVSCSYLNGYRAVGTMVYSWPDAVDKAKAAAELVQKRLARLNLNLEKVNVELLGLNACHGTLGAQDADPAEVMLRLAVRSADKSAVARFTREVAPLVLGGPPSATGYAGGKGDVQEVVAYWPALIKRARVQAVTELL